MKPNFLEFNLVVTKVLIKIVPHYTHMILNKKCYPTN